MRWSAGTAALVAGLGAALGAGAWFQPAAALDGVTEQCRFSDDRFTEISGMTYSQRHEGVIYVHNDSSGGPRIYAVDSSTCETLATLTLAGAEARDFEAIGSGTDPKGRPILWVGDIGDNRDSWSDVRLLRVREPKTLKDRTMKVRTYRFTYPDGPTNAEALLTDPASQKVWVVTKKLAAGEYFRVPLKTGTVTTARPVGKAGGLVTDGSMSPTDGRFAVRDYVDAEVRQGRPPGTDPITVYLPVQLQGEAITWTSDGRALLVASERDDRLLRVEVAAAPVAQASGEEPTGAPSLNAQSLSSSGTETEQQLRTQRSDGGEVVAGVVAALLIVAGVVGLVMFEWRRRLRDHPGPDATP